MASNQTYPLSVIVITRNEERNIGECLESVKWASELIVVDSQSSDKTVDIAKKYTNKVCVTEWLGYAGAKNFALEKAAQPWVLWLDADERVPEPLVKEIQHIVQTNSQRYSAYDVARRAFFLGKWIKHCGWYPGYVVRLFRREGAKFNDAKVHERLEFSGSKGRLKNDLLHFTDRNIFHYFAKFNSYTSLAAEDVAAAGKRFSMNDVLVRPPYMFFKMYILRRGFLDGMHGFVLCILSSLYVFTKYAKVWEKQR